MLDYLKDKKDVGFFLSVQALMQTCRYILTGSCCHLTFILNDSLNQCLCLFCSVLDLNAFERQNKAEGLGMVSEEGTSK